MLLGAAYSLLLFLIQLCQLIQEVANNFWEQSLALPVSFYKGIAMKVYVFSERIDEKTGKKIFPPVYRTSQAYCKEKNINPHTGRKLKVKK